MAIVRDPSLRPGRGSASDRFASLAMTEGEFDGFRFRYRWSSFKDWPGFIIMSAVFALQAGQKSEIQAAMKTVMASRHAHQPLPEQSAGCIFKNPSADEAAGKLIDECGLKGMRVGGAEVSLRHANFIVNTGSATAQDIRKLIQIVKDHVKKEMGIVLEEEVRYLCENHEL
ncbi:hypothetical protein HY573_02345 [Candidatus Parcubacteria bacterium]|nr:hypothetical protein [Candidatus Parcubacteria bacterium]